MHSLFKIFSLVAIFFVVTSCTKYQDRYFTQLSHKKPQDNESQLYEKKRAPLYNKKYIKIAKKNIIEGNYSEEDYDDLEEMYDEIESSSRSNKKMYRDVIRAENIQRQEQIREQNNTKRKKYPKFRDNSSNVQKANDENKNLQAELKQIKKCY